MKRIRFVSRWLPILIIAALAASGQASVKPLLDSLNESGDLRKKADLPRQILIAGMSSGEAQTARDGLSDFLVRTYTAKRDLQSTRLTVLSGTADAMTCLKQWKDTQIRDDVLKWMFASNERMRSLAAIVHAKDDLSAAVKHIESLHDADPKGRDGFFKLIMALALVWDQQRPRIHSQMGYGPPMDDTTMQQRYEFFSDVYATGYRKSILDRSSIRDLMFVVDVPVAMSELEWARKNVKGSATSWKKRHSEIVYDKKRMNDGVRNWPHGTYTLAAIKEKGGICTDQAYYAVLSARANGIPAVFFRGTGRRGGHAWFAYSKSANTWEMDIGRYTFDKYTIGYATDPQTNSKMTDHQIDYLCDSSFRTRQYEQASQYTRIADVLLERRKYAEAVEAASAARRLVKKYERPWLIELMALKAIPKLDRAALLLDQKAKVFSKYHDIRTNAREEQAELLEKLGRNAEAERILDALVRRVGRDRHDLAESITMKRVEKAVAAGQGKKARSLLEDLLEGQADGGEKVLPLLRNYLGTTKQIGQTKEAARFLSSYVKRIRTSGVKDMRPFLQIQLQAHENDNDTKGAARVQRDIDRLRAY